MDFPRLINSDRLETPQHSIHRGRRSIIKRIIEPKQCTFCNKYIDVDEFEEHVDSCNGPTDVEEGPILAPITETPTMDSAALESSLQPKIHGESEDKPTKHSGNEDEEHDDRTEHATGQAVHLIDNVEDEPHPQNQTRTENAENEDASIDNQTERPATDDEPDDHQTKPETNNDVDLTHTEQLDKKRETSDDQTQDLVTSDEPDDRQTEDETNDDQTKDPENHKELGGHPTEEPTSNDQPGGDLGENHTDNEEVDRDQTRNLPKIDEPKTEDATRSTNDDDHRTEHANGNSDREKNLSEIRWLSMEEAVDSDASAEARINNIVDLSRSQPESTSSLEDVMTKLNKLDLIDTDSVIGEASQTCSDTSSPIQFHDVSDRISRRSSIQFQAIQDDDRLNEDNLDDYGTPRSVSSMINDENCKKNCPLCQCMIDESEFMQHIMDCNVTEPIRDEPPVRTQKPTSSKENRTKSVLDSDIIREKTKECIICFKPIRESKFVQHVHTCLAESTAATTTTTANKSAMTCFSCHNPVDLENNLGREMTCPSRHVYCFPCLQSSMEKYFLRRSPPLCHPTKCDYELSAHDIAFLPLVRRVSDRLLQLARGQQRPQCPHCQLYIDVNETEEFYNHIDVCNGDLISCRYCFHRYSTDQLESHVTRCENDRSSSGDKLINYVTKRTKYPFKKEQISLFIRQKQSRNYGRTDPFEIINALTEYGPIFPYDTPTKECDVCMEASPYDDIYVFDCTENHKLCYSCFHRSCETKMANGEILTCGICSNPLREGELNQLRLSPDEIKKFRDYQTKKTLDIYSNQTRGVIKCPNQNCSWIAEADDPTERIRVRCPVCKREFCSLCNEQYHYRTTCPQLPQITQQWFMWCERERERYAIIRGREQEAYATKLKENNVRNDELRRRYEDLMRDEEYKAQNCRFCPSCKRVVQRLEGCDKMICGQDAHGGNVQSGCGTKFNWQQAQPYQPSTAFQPQQTPMDLPKPEHLTEHIGVKCDQCKKNVVGIRFDCVHCPSLTFCEKCEQQATLEHSHDNQRKKQQSHVFRLMIKSEEVSS